MGEGGGGGSVYVKNFMLFCIQITLGGGGGGGGGSFCGSVSKMSQPVQTARLIGFS